MNSKYQVKGSQIRVFREDSVSMLDNLPVNHYIVKADMNGIFLDTIEPFTLPRKMYGDVTRRTERILHTFNDRSNSTGVLLTGEKGSGKTLLAKNLSLTALAQGVSTIIVNSPFHNEDFHQLIQNIKDPAIIIFDEFEKVYDQEQQESILTLLDGVFATKKLFLFTCNDKWRVNPHMRNRPGRIFYLIEYKGITTDFVEEYCNDNLHDKTHIPMVCKISQLYAEFNFDMLKALVEEMNRYNEPPMKAIEMINAKPDNDVEANFKVEVVVTDKVKGKATSPIISSIYPEKINTLPIGKNHDIAVYFNSGRRNTMTLSLNDSNLTKIDADSGIFVYTVGNAVVTFTRVHHQSVNYYGML